MTAWEDLDKTRLFRELPLEIISEGCNLWPIAIKADWRTWFSTVTKAHVSTDKGMRAGLVTWFPVTQLTARLGTVYMGTVP